MDYGRWSNVSRSERMALSIITLFPLSSYTYSEPLRLTLRASPFSIDTSDVSNVPSLIDCFVVDLICRINIKKHILSMYDSSRKTSQCSVLSI